MPKYRAEFTATIRGAVIIDITDPCYASAETEKQVKLLLRSPAVLDELAPIFGDYEVEVETGWFELMMASKCQCEQANCHGDTGCSNKPTRTLSTIYGHFDMCASCAAKMPREYLQPRLSQAQINKRLKAVKDTKGIWSNLPKGAEWVIYNPTAKLFWSNKEGWCALGIATRFTSKEKEVSQYLPEANSLWVRISEGDEY